MIKKVLVISPHPDDEAIGCGGTISKHVAEGDTVHVIFLTSGEKGGHGLPEAATKTTREAEALRAAEILGTHQNDFWREPDGDFKANKINVDRLIKKVEQLMPEIIYVPHSNEAHPDHRSAAKIVKKAIEGKQNEQKIPLIYMYEVWTPLQKFDHIVDISGYIEVKNLSIQAHASQCAALKFEAAILGLNRYRGEMHSWPGGDYAEAFVEMKIVTAEKRINQL